jgi:hypothetical protein
MIRRHRQKSKKNNKLQNVAHRYKAPKQSKTLLRVAIGKKEYITPAKVKGLHRKR